MTIQELIAKVRGTIGVVDSATTLIMSLSERIRNAAADPAALQALADDLDREAAELAAAIEAAPPEA